MIIAPEPVHVEVSDDAGSFVCEYTYYTSMDSATAPVVFVHVPPLGAPYDLTKLQVMMRRLITVVVEDTLGIDVPKLFNAADNAGQEAVSKWVGKFKEMLANNADMPTAVAAIHALIGYIENCEATTVVELLNTTTAMIAGLTTSMASRITSVTSGCALFLDKIVIKGSNVRYLPPLNFLLLIHS